MHYSPTPTFADVKLKNRIHNYNFKSHMVHNNEYDILQEQINALTAAIMIDVINNLSQDIRTPMMEINGVFDAIDCNSAESQAYGMNIEEKELMHLFSPKVASNILNSLEDGEVLRYGYGTNNGTRTIGKHSEFQFVYELTPEMKQLLKLDNSLIESYPDDTIPPANFNSVSIKIYYYILALCMVKKVVNFHCDVSYDRHNPKLWDNNSSQTPNTPVIIRTCGDIKELTFKLFKNRPQEVIHDTDIIFTQTDSSTFLLHPTDEKPVFVEEDTPLPETNEHERYNLIVNNNIIRWKHKAHLKSAKNKDQFGMSISSRDVQNIVIVDKSSLIVGKVDRKGNVIRFEKNKKQSQKIESLKKKYITTKRLGMFNTLKEHLKKMVETCVSNRN